MPRGSRTLIPDNVPKTSVISPPRGHTRISPRPHAAHRFECVALVEFDVQGPEYYLDLSGFGHCARFGVCNSYRLLHHANHACR